MAGWCHARNPPSLHELSLSPPPPISCIEIIDEDGRARMDSPMVQILFTKTKVCSVTHNNVRTTELVGAATSECVAFCTSDSSKR